MTCTTFDLLQWMEPEVRAAFGSVVRRRRYAAGRTIYWQGDPGTEMFRIISGSVRMVVTRADGREIAYGLCEPGDCFGDSSLVDGDPRPQSVEAVTDVELDVLEAADFRRLRERFRNFDDALLRLLARQMRVVSMHYADANLNPLAVRVAGRLHEAACSFGSQADDGLRLTVPLAQSGLALMVGASRQAVNKVLRKFQSEGLLRIEYGTVLILDPEGVRQRARGH